jgi:hypothetical protein
VFTQSINFLASQTANIIVFAGSQSVNFWVYQTANVIIFAGSFWASLSRKVPTGMVGTFVLWLLCMAALGNMAEIGMCHSWAEVWLDDAMALCIVWVFWHLEIRPRFCKGKK